MIFLIYLFFFSLLSILVDLSMLFSIVSLFLGAILCFNSFFSLQGIAICAFGLLHLISRLRYHSRKMTNGSSSKSFYISCDFFSIFIATVIFAIPIWHIIIKSKITLEISPLYIFIASLFISWAILFKIVDRIFIHNKETQEVILGDYFTIYRTRKALTHIYVFKFKDSTDCYSTRVWRYKIFINKINSKFFCTLGKGIFGTTYITSIKLIEAAGINIPENTDLYSTFPFRKRSLTKKIILF